MKTLFIPDVIKDALALGAKVAVSVSAGKDSQALAIALAAQGIGSYIIHMDLGRAEWPQTVAMVDRIAESSNLPVIVVSRPQGDLVQEMTERGEKLQGTGKPFWPSAANRYCTADQKRSQADKVYRRDMLIISAEGIRGQESAKRAKDAVVSVRKQITAKALQDLPPSDALAAWRTQGGRLSLTWNAIHDWTLADVWEACGTSVDDLSRRQALYQAGFETEALNGWPCHPAYVFGNARLSCVFCVLATENDLRVGARHNPALAAHYIALENRFDSTFKHKRSLADILTNEVTS